MTAPDTTPESLLQSALEKIVYFEARANQLTSDLEQARGEAIKLRHEVAQAAQREIELRRTLAELEVRLTRAHAEREEAATVVEALKRERSDLIGKVLDAARIQGAHHTQTADDFDLAQFISLLRSEVARGPSLTLPAEGEGVVTVARQLEAQGRLSVTASDVSTLTGGRAFEGRSEETLFGFSVRELSAPDAAARGRAAERLAALGHPAGAPALVAALAGEREAQAQVPMLVALSALGGSEASAAVLPLATSAAPEVRVAALKALLKLDPSRAAPHLSAAMRDPDRAVRRRASLLALSLTGAEALPLGEQACADVDPDVRALGCLVLGASGSLQARAPLMNAFGDGDERVRRAAGQALTRLLGHDVTGLASLDAGQRRREVRRLALLPAMPRSMAPRTAVESPAASPVRSAVAVSRPKNAGGPGSPELGVPVAIQSPSKRAFSAAAGVVNQSSRQRVAVLEVDTTQSALSAAGSLAVLAELRAAIRGRTLDELAAGIAQPVAQAQQALTALLSSAQVIRRGHKYFIA